MAYTIEIVKTCDSCGGTGQRVSYNQDHVQIIENPCSGCGGDGKTTVSLMDDTLLQEMNEKLDYIKTRVRKIWLKVKDEGDPE